MLRNTSANGIQVRNIIFHSDGFANKNTDPQAEMALSIEHATAARSKSR